MSFISVIVQAAPGAPPPLRKRPTTSKPPAEKPDDIGALKPAEEASKGALAEKADDKDPSVLAKIAKVLPKLAKTPKPTPKPTTPEPLLPLKPVVGMSEQVMNMIKEDATPSTTKSPLQRMAANNPSIKKVEEGVEKAADAVYRETEVMRNKIGNKAVSAHSDISQDHSSHQSIYV